MIDHSLRVALCHSITARAHLAGAEAAELEAQTKNALYTEGDFNHRAQIAELARLTCATRRRYWREVSAAARLSGMAWPEAEALGVEPPATVSASQED